MEAEISETSTESANTSGIATGLVRLRCRAHTAQGRSVVTKTSTLLVQFTVVWLVHYYSIKCDAMQNGRKRQILTTRTETEEKLSVKCR